MAYTNYSELLKDPRWQKKRLKILERDGFICQQCFDEESTLNVHHIKYLGKPWEIEDRYLITLCQDCHKGVSECTTQIKELIIELQSDLCVDSFYELKEIILALKERNLDPISMSAIKKIVENFSLDEFSGYFHKFYNIKAKK